jgi:hypothetical protein
VAAAAAAAAATSCVVRHAVLAVDEQAGPCSWCHTHCICRCWAFVISRAELPTRLQHLEAVNCGLKGALPALPRGMRRVDLSDNALSGQLAGIDTTHMEVRGSRGAVSAQCIVLRDA